MKIDKEIKSKFRNEGHKAIVNLHFTNLAFNNYFSEVLKDHDISMQQFNVLRILRGQHPDAASIGLVKDRMLDKNSDVSRIIDRLKQKKLVSRKECKQDRRQKDVLITEEGLMLLAKIDANDRKMDELLSSIEEKDLKKLNKLLDKLRSSLKN